MRFDRLKLAGLVALTLVLMVALGACDSAGNVAGGDAGFEYDVTVIVVDEGNEILEGVRVTLDELEEVTGENGVAEFEDVREGSYELDVELDGYAASSGDTGSVIVSENSTEFTVEMAESSEDADDGDGEEDDTDDGSDDGDTDDGSDGKIESDFAWADEEDSVIVKQFSAAEEKKLDLGQLADGESAVVAISPLNIDPESTDIYDGRLEITYSDGSASSQTSVESLGDGVLTGDESSKQAELDADLRELEDELLAQDLLPAAEVRDDVSAQDYSYKIGDSRSFYNRFDEEIDSTLKAIGDEVLIYLEDGYDLKTETLEEIAAAYDKNIYPTVMNHFAFHDESEYDWDGNGRTIIFIEDMGGSPQTGMVMGYFHSKDYYADSQISSKSNEADMFYVNYQGIKEVESGNTFKMDDILRTVAHEFQHLVFFVNKIQAGRRISDTWINEGFSMLAEYLTGYRDYNGDLKISNNYFSEPEQTPTMAWEQNLSNYGASALKAYYLYEKLGSGIIEDIQTSSNSAENVISDKYIDFSGLMLSWMLSNYIDGENLDKFSYSRFDLSARPALAATIDGSFSRDFSVKSTAVKYFKIEGNGSNVSLEVEGLAEDTGVAIYRDGEGWN